MFYCNIMDPQEQITPPDELHKIIDDFVKDLITTFPEYMPLINKWWTGSKEKDTLIIFKFCSKIFPERFFDILYKNTDIFSDESNINTEFLPGIVFKHLWNSDISDSTKETIWNYLQLILFAVVKSTKDSADFGDSAKLFESINQDDLKKKLEETMENMQNMFDSDTNNTSDDNSGNTVPNADQIHSHLNNMMEGKLGKLAMELAEETAKDLDIDMDETTDAKAVYQKLFQDPNKMMNMVKNIGSKIDGKIKSGELKESELMSEGMDLLNKMKDMPGMGDMQSMFSKMGMGGKGAKMNTAAMESKLNANMKTAQMKERLKAKATANALARELAKSKSEQNLQMPTISEDEIVKIFSTGETVEKTPRNPTNSKKKKKGKK